MLHIYYLPALPAQPLIFLFHCCYRFAFSIMSHTWSLTGYPFLILHDSSAWWFWESFMLKHGSVWSFLCFWEALNCMEMSDITATYFPFMLFPNSWPCRQNFSHWPQVSRDLNLWPPLLTWKWINICSVWSPAHWEDGPSQLSARVTHGWSCSAPAVHFG